MKRTFLLKTMLLLCALVAGSSSVWAEDVVYKKYSGSITEGDYVIYYNGNALKNTVSNNRFDNQSVTPSEDKIANPAAAIVWHIAKDGDYWTIYNAAVEKYAGGTNSKNRGALLSDVTDYAKWTVTGSNTYDFANKGRAEGSSDTGNKWLRNNGTNGWACYADATGGALSLYKKAVAHTVTFSINGVTCEDNVVEGDAITFPANPDAIGGKEFVGWTTEAIDGSTDTAPTFVTSATMGIENVTYYAVFADAEGGGDDTYEKLGSDVFDTNAKYVIGAEQLSTNNTMWYFSSYSGTDSNINWGVMTNTPATTKPVEFTLSGSASALVAKDSNGNYLKGLTTGKFYMSTTSTSVCLDTDGTIKNTSNGNYYLRHNYNGGNGGLRWYNSTTGTAAYFYKVVPGIVYSDYCTSVIVSKDVTSFGWATYVAPYDLEFPEGRAYVVTDATVGNAITKASVTQVPANTPVLLKEEGTVTATVLTTTPDAPATNLLSVCDGTIASGKYAYVLAKNGTSAGFKQWTGDADVLTNRVVLLLDEEASAPSFLSLDEGTTSIEDAVKSKEIRDKSYYNLNGQRVAQPTKGLYIVNGHKVVIK